MLLMECTTPAQPGSHSASASAHCVSSVSPAWTYPSESLAPTVAGRSTGSADLTSEVQVPASVLAELHNIEASSSGRGLDECFSSSLILTGIGNDPAATFAGAFRTSIRGLAHRFLQHLAAAVQHFSQRSSSEVHNRLSAALNRCQAQIKQCSGLAGCAVLISSDTLAFCASGSCLLATGQGQGAEACATDLKQQGQNIRGPQKAEEESVSLSSLQQQGRSGFGSLIPVERSSAQPVDLESSAQFIEGTHNIDDSHCFLVLGAGCVAEPLSPETIVAYIHRSRQSAGIAGRTAASVAAKCQSMAAERTEGAEEQHAAIIILHFKLPVLPFETATIQSDSSSAASRPASPSQEGRQAQGMLPPLLLSPSGRRVRFLQPVEGSEFAEAGNLPAPEGAIQSSNPAIGDRLLHSESSGSIDSGTAASGGFPEGSSLLSSGSLLSRPNMSIPEEGALSEEHSALQLPPPLLAPVRKAYPSGSQELRILPEMLSSPSPVRKAKLGRAASVNSPEGLWPLPPQRGIPAPLLKPFVRSSSGGDFGSRSRGCGEEGRVRGGLPRISSVPSLLAGNTPSPTASNTSSPGASAGTRRSPFSNKPPVPTLADFLARKGSAGSGSTSSRSLASTGSGVKTRGHSAALRLLQASRHGPTNPSSAPADLGRLLERSTDASFELDAEGGLQSSGTASCGLSSAVSIASRGSIGARRIPILNDPLDRQAATLSSSEPDCEERRQSQDSVPTTCPRERDCDGASLQSTSRVIPVVPTVLEKNPGRSRSACPWPELDSAAGVGLLSRLDPELRQHSARAFSNSSLADSVDSLTRSVADLETGHDSGNGSEAV